MAGNVWNPNAPGLLGVEWMPTLSGAHSLVSQGNWGQRIRSRSAETIDLLRWYGRDTPLPGGVQQSTVVVVEVCPAGSEAPAGAAVVTRFVPNLIPVVGSWIDETSAPATPGKIDDGAVPNLADYVFPNASSTMEVEFNSATAGAGSRIARLQVEMVHGTYNYGSPGSSNLTVSLKHVPSGTTIPLIVNMVTAGVATTTYDLGEYNPHSGRVWTPTDIQGFDNGTYRIAVLGQPGGFTYPIVYSLSLLVTAYAVENRAAAGVRVSSFADGPICTANLLTLPGGADNWAKPAAGDFTLLFRQSQVIPPSAALLGAAVAPHVLSWGVQRVGGVEALAPVPGAVSGVNGALTAFTPSTGRLLGVLPVTTGAVVSPDGLPFPIDDAVLPAAPVASTQPWRQRFTPAASRSYSIVKVAVQARSAVGDLTIAVRRNSDNVLMGGAGTLTAAAAAAAPDEGGGWRVIDVTLAAPAALISGTAYYLNFTTTDGAAVTGWQLRLLGDDLDAAWAGGPATYESTVETAFDNGVSQTHQDLAAYLIEQPPAIGPGTTATATSVALPGDGTDCSIDSYEAVVIDWPSSALAGSFLRYEIERTEDGGATWSPIGYVTSEAASTFTDHEGRRGVAAGYRVRVVRVDLAASAWTATVTATPDAVGCGLLFVSNEAPSLAVAYEVPPDIEYEFLSPATDVLVPIYGRDFQVAFMEAENRGVAFTVELFVNFRRDPSTVGLGSGVAAFLPLRTISRSPLSYVVVLDRHGNRFYAHVQVASGRARHPANRYSAVVTVTEVTDEPSIAVQP